MSHTVPTVNLVYIPRIHISYDDKFIRKTFEDLELGIIENIYSFNPHTKYSKYYSAMICFSYWNINNPAAVNLAEKILNDEMEARLVYDDPNYWVLLPTFSENYIEKDAEHGIEHELHNLNQEQINYLTNYVDKLSEENVKLENIIKNMEKKINDIKERRKDSVSCDYSSVGSRLASVSNWHTNPKIVRNFIIHKEDNKSRDIQQDYKEIIMMSCIP